MPPFFSDRFAKKNQAVVVVKRRGVTIGVAVKTSARRAKGFTLRTMLNIGYTKVVRISDVARVWRCDRSTIRRVQYSVASAFEVSQRTLVEQFAAFVQNERPVVVAIGLAWDETSEKFKLPLHAGLNPEQVRSAWHVLVSCAEYLVGIADEGGQHHSRFFQVLRPPVPLLTTSAGCLMQGLFCMLAQQCFQNFQEAAVAYAKFVFISLDRDGASSNDRMVAAFGSALPSEVLLTDRVCGNHSTNLVESAVIGGHWMSLLGRMYSVALLLRQGAYFLRLVHSVGGVVDAAVAGGAILHRVPPPAGASEYARAMGDFVLRNLRSIMAFRKRATVHDDSDNEDGAESDPFNKRRDKSAAAWLSAWQEFTSVFNGPLWGPLRHYCADRSCCNGFDVETTKAKMRHALAGLTFRVMPCVPVKAKWTKTLPCIAWFVMAVACMPCLQSAWPLAFGRMSVNVAPLGFMAQGAMDAVQMEEIHWQVVQGARAKAGLAMIKDPRTPTRLLVLGIVMEATMCLTRWFMKRSAPSSRLRSSPGHCALMDFVNPVFSPVTRVLQFLSALLAGHSPRLCLIWQRDGVASWADWCARHPAELRELRHAITIAASWVYRRFWEAGMSYPWRLAFLVDARVPMEERRVVAEAFWALPVDAIDTHCSLRLRERLRSAEELFDADVQVALKRWAWTVRLSIAPVEWTHGRNRRRSDSSSTWAGFVAQYMNQDRLCCYMFGPYPRPVAK